MGEGTMKLYSHGMRRVWYDRHLRMWTLQTVDFSGNQVGEVEYVFWRFFAMVWLKGKS